jgi:hypothetical protein
MIGVVADVSEHAVVREFFQLFKTPWEFYRPGADYDAILCLSEREFEPGTARLIVRHAGHKLQWDEENEIEISRLSSGWAQFKDMKLPIYGDAISVRCSDAGDLNQIACTIRCAGLVTTRVGYDLAHEVRVLLTQGQPAANAAIPTLELHITLLRKVIVDAGIAFMEIPPVPDEHTFIACLTHDVDHPSIRRHKFDHTIVGFLCRAVLGSAIELIRGRIPLPRLAANWWAALKLPFVQLGLATDFWYSLERYVELEQGCRSTFFVIPFKSDPGKTRSGAAPKERAAAYGAVDIADCLQKLTAAGCEIGVHGLDAWISGSRGQQELAEVKRALGEPRHTAIGVRMHWLYFDQESPAVLEQAGADYDSTIGYNETIGYRAGTTQAYKHLNTEHLLELPLHVMDTALFYPSYLHLSPTEAQEQIGRILDNAVRFGGCVTFNWHDRSIAPERLWDRTYVDAIAECKARGAWMGAATEVVGWFRLRRSVCLEGFRSEPSALSAKLSAHREENLPGLRLRIHEGNTTSSDELRVGQSREMNVPA